MNKPKIRIADTQFAHGTSLGSGDLKIYPTYFDWYRGDTQIGDVIVITESCFHLIDQFPEKIKIAMLIEPVSIDSKPYFFVKENIDKFDSVLTHNWIFADEINMWLRHNELPEKCFFYFFGGCWIEKSDWVSHEYKKTRGISIIASNKTKTIGHKLRHEFINSFSDKLDGIYGRGYKPIDNKIDALRDYQFTVVIENEKSDIWITEKLIDAFMARCVPIYWGSNKVGNIFNVDGIIKINYNPGNERFQEAVAIALSQAEKINFNTNNLLKSAINQNFYIAQKYLIPEDRMWLTFFSKKYKEQLNVSL